MVILANCRYLSNEKLFREFFRREIDEARGRRRKYRGKIPIGHSDDLAYFVGNIGNNRTVTDFSGICWETLQTAGLGSAF
jgi:hypothetical protein